MWFKGDRDQRSSLLSKKSFVSSSSFRGSTFGRTSFAFMQDPEETYDDTDSNIRKKPRFSGSYRISIKPIAGKRARKN